LTAVLGRWPADRLGRSSQGLSCHQWLEWELEASPVDRSGDAAGKPGGGDPDASDEAVREIGIEPDDTLGGLECT
jgi:hypothetical protein